MFKRLSKASALREELEDDEDENSVSLATTIDENSDSDPAYDSSSDSDESEEDSDESDADDTEFSVKHAMQSPIYIDDEAVEKVPIFRCVACPLVTLKNEKSIDVHLESKNHKRRFTRFVTFAQAEAEREGDKVMHLDPRTLVDLLEDQRREFELAKKDTGKRKQPDADYVPRLERRKMRRALRREKRANLQKPSE